MSRILSVVRHKRLTVGQASPAVVTTAPAPTLNQTADVVPVRPRGVRTIRRHKRIYFGKPATTQLVSEDFYAALNARMDGAFAAVTMEASARVDGDAAVASTLTALSSSFTSYQATANASLGTLDSRMTTAEAGIVSANAAITSGDAAVASTVTALSASFTTYQTAANTQLGSLDTRVTTAEAGIISANTARADGDAAVASTVTALTASFTSYQTTANGRLGSLETSTGTLTTRITTAEAGIISANTARADGDAAVASTVTSLTTSFNSYTSTANGRLGALEGTAGTLGTRMTSAEAAITAESSARSSGDSAEATARTALSTSFTSQITNLGSGTIQQVFKQGSAPTLDQVSPPGKNRINQSSFLDGAFNGWKVGTGYSGGNTRGLFGVTETWTPPGARTAFVVLNDTPASGIAFELYNDGADALPRYAVTPGKKYEFSAYIANHRCQFIILRMIFLDGSSGYISEFQSAQVTTQGGGGGNTLASFERAFVICTAPAGATDCFVSAYGVANGSTTPYIMLCKPFFGLAQADQTVPSPWQDANTGAIWINTSDNNKLHVWNGFAWEAKDDSRIAANAAAITVANAAITAEQSARSDGDAAVASTVTALSASFTSYQTTANGRLGALEGTAGSLGTRMTSAEAAITSEASTRASGDGANASAISSLAATVSSNQSSLSASITAEQNVRAALVTQLGSGASQQVFKQGSAPTLDQVSPPGKNRINQSSFLDGAFNGWKVGTGYSGGNTRGLFGVTETWTPPGARTAFVVLNDTPASGIAFELYNDGADALPRYAVTPGKKYEFSAYIANHRCQFIILRMIFLDGSSGYISEFQSAQVTTQGGGGGNTLASFERAFAIGVAPAGATQCYVSVYGVANGTITPYIMLCKPFFGLAQADQTIPSPWQDANTGAIWINTSDNNKLHVWNGFAWEAKDDSRIAATASQVSTIQTTVNGHTASITSQQTSINGLSALATLRVNGGGAVAGYDIYAGGGSSTIKFQAENFEIVGSGGSGVAPFRVSGGVTYINEARIANGAISEVTAGMAAGYVDLAVTVEAGAKLVFILSTLGGALQPDMELYDLTGGASVVNIAPSAYSFDLWVNTGPDSGYYATQTIRQPTTYQWVITPGYTGYRAFRLRNNTGNLTSGYSTVVMTILQMKK